MSRVLSGIKPTGAMTIGNYIGALKNFPKFQKGNDVYMFVADLHALTLPIDPVVLRSNTYDIISFYLAAGLDPNSTVLFKQSDVMEVGVLNSILINYIYMGELSRMTQYKAKVASMNSKEIGCGLFAYPVLMAADLFLYDTEVCPVGEDQIQHVELARDIAKRFNSRYKKEILCMPKVEVTKVGKRIMSLTEPTKKMSKSDNGSGKGEIYLAEDEKSTAKKIMSAVTDSGNEVKYDLENKPGIANLLTIYAAMKQINIEDAEQHSAGSSYGSFKKEVAEAVNEELRSFRAKYSEFRADQNYLDEVLANGAAKARGVASKVLQRVKGAVGL